MSQSTVHGFTGDDGLHKELEETPVWSAWLQRLNGWLDVQQGGVQFLSDDFLYSAVKTPSNWTIKSDFAILYAER